MKKCIQISKKNGACIAFNTAKNDIKVNIFQNLFFHITCLFKHLRKMKKNKQTSKLKTERKFNCN